MTPSEPMWIPNYSHPRVSATTAGPGTATCASQHGIRRTAADLAGYRSRRRPADQDGTRLPVLDRPRFRHRIEAVVERFSDMQADLDRERKTMMRLWAKREEQIRGVVESTAGLYGDLQGIAGRSLLEIDGLASPLLDGPVAGEAAE
jgi:Uncharacterized protein conserved in bacteria (DUF2130)